MLLARLFDLIRFVSPAAVYFGMFIMFAMKPHHSVAQDLPQIVINEINCDNPAGPDNAEFIELYGAPGSSLDSLVLVLFEGTDDLSYAAYDLDGYFLDASGFFVIGGSAVSNVDFIIPNGIISNGQDGMALYRRDATDFPSGTAPDTDQLVDACVYGTADPQDNGLIALLGLDAYGYEQLDETIQPSPPDFSLSRIPDGGLSFLHSVFNLQGITPGTFNTPQCQGGTLSFADLTSTLLICTENPDPLVEFTESEEAYGQSVAYIITDAFNIIIDTTQSLSFDFSGFPAASYRIFSMHYNGTITEGTINPGANVQQTDASGCSDLSENYLIVEIAACNTCDAGEVTADFGNSITFCSGSNTLLNLSNNSDSGSASYFYVIASNENLILDIADAGFDYGALVPGVYYIYGIAFTGSINSSSLEYGQPVEQIFSDSCISLSSNYLTLDVADCGEIAACEKIFISEYLEGNAGTRALELFNPSLNSISLDEYSLWLYTNGSDIAADTLFLSGNLEPLSTYTIANPGTGLGNGLADPAVIGLADLTDFIANFTGNDAIELRHNTVVTDVIGIVGENPGINSGWTTIDGSTINQDLVRKPYVQTPADNWLIGASQWDAFPLDQYTGLGSHFFQPCTDTLIAGFWVESIMLDESAMVAQIQVQCLNASVPLTFDVSISGGSADIDDYLTPFPFNLNFDENTMLLDFTVELIDDQFAEIGESIVLTLSCDVPVFWTNQSITINIPQNDFNCGGGNLETANGTVIEQCADLGNSPVFISSDSPFPSASYLFVITNENDQIADTTSANPVDLDNLGTGTYKIFGLSYTGELLPASLTPGLAVENILADSCVSISENYIMVIRTDCQISGCDAGIVSTADGETFQTVCLENGATVVVPVNTGASVNDNYLYLLLDSNGAIAASINDAWNASAALPGTYSIVGLSYTGTLDENSILAGLLPNNITSDGCVSLTENAIQVQVFSCAGPDPCSRLFFSEYIEETGSNRAIEIYNPMPLPADLSDYTIHMYSNGSLVPEATLHCSGTLMPYDVYTIVTQGNGIEPTDPQILSQQDTLHPIADLSGNDAFELLYLDEVIDVIGQVGENPGQLGWQFGNSSTSNHVLVRRPEVTSPSDDWNIVSGQWIPYEPDDFSHIGFHVANDCGLSDSPVISFIDPEILVTENSGTVSVAIYSSNPGSPFDIMINTSGTALEGEDYESNFPTVLQIPAGQDTIYLNIVITNDQTNEGSETIELEITTDESVYFGNSNAIVYIEEVISTMERTYAGMHIWPNPAGNQLHIEGMFPIDNMTIRDITGKIVLQNELAAKHYAFINLESIPSGVYTIEVSNSGVRIAQKLIVSK
jgi:hypothetical protein